LNADGTKVLEDGKEVLVFQDYPILNYGPFIQSVVDFLLVAAALFLVIKLMNTAKAKFEEKKAEEAPATPEDVLLLREIRDSLSKR
jgi:large conductance mechanosensitive channel